MSKVAAISASVSAGVTLCGSGHHLVGPLPWCAAGDAVGIQVGHDGGAVHAELVGERLDRRACLVPGDQVIDPGVGEASLNRV